MTHPVDEYDSNFLGQMICEGDLVVYPGGGGRSVQMIEGEVLSMEVMSNEEWDALSEWHQRQAHPGQLMSITLQPTGRTSRWKQHYSAKDEKPARKVTLTANAASVVLVQ